MKKVEKRAVNKHINITNIIYALKNIWRWDKAFYLYFIPSIPFSVLLPLAAIYFPKIVIDAVESDQSTLRIVFIIGGYFVALFCINIVSRFCDC